MALQFSLNSMTRLAGAALLASSLSALPALAQTPAAPPYVAPTVGVQTFLSDPGAELRQNPTGGPSLISQIRDLAVANPSTLQPIISLLAGANKDQKTAIASGLAQAAKIVVRTNPQYATQIQLAIADTKDQDVVLAYAAAAGENPIGAAGGGGGASGGSSGGQTSSLFGSPTGTGTAQDIPGGSTPTNPFSYTSGVSGGSSTNNGTTGVTNLTLSVSP